jgi:rRNA-processing protein FCF1
LRQIEKKVVVLGMVMGQLEALKQRKTMAIKGKQQIELFSQHHLERVSTL